jgi:hypothetical protein
MHGVNWYKVQAVVVLCVGIYTQFPHTIKRLTLYLFMFINLGEKYFSTLEKKKGVVSLLLSTIVHNNKLTTPFFFSSVEKYFSPRFINMNKYRVNLFILFSHVINSTILVWDVKKPKDTSLFFSNFRRLRMSRADGAGDLSNISQQ